MKRAELSTSFILPGFSASSPQHFHGFSVHSTWGVVGAWLWGVALVCLSHALLLCKLQHTHSIVRLWFCDEMASGGETVLKEYEWEKLPDMPTKRCFTVGVHHLNNLYILGQLNASYQAVTRYLQIEKQLT